MTSRSRRVSAPATSADVGPGVFAGDRAHGIDVLVDELDRDARDFRRVFEKPAQAFGDAGGLGIAERCGFALDVVGGAEQRLVRLLGDAELLDVPARRFEALAFGLHPCRKFGRELDQRRFGARDRIVVAFRGRRNGLAQFVRRRDHFMVGISRDRWRIVLAVGHARDAPDGQTKTLALSSNGCWRVTSALPPLRRSGPT